MAAESSRVESTGEGDMGGDRTRPQGRPDHGDRW